ncbi:MULTISPECIES: diacylglycerol kinase family protein [Bacillaceae]|uniref:DAGKc domain-containing protein n=1 Tax=Domibacillus aminovorans TaxID=29332 RepID=A0A177KJQ2_9BACI|nr:MULTISPECIES: diacylglycerol kinase family protein [Bacillaceae]OAH53599.1 hypothetical protein AWH48_09950 [Domibacillus aminovorans]
MVHIYLIIVNPSSGSGNARSLWTKVERHLKKKHVQYDALIGGSEASAREFVWQKMQEVKVKAVVVIGGDGTVNAILQDVVYTDTAIAVLPAGSGNDIARIFGLTDHPGQFVDQLLTARKRKQIDVMKVNTSYGLTVAGAGLDADIAERINRAFYKKWFNKIGAGSFTYMIGTILSSLLFKPFKSTIMIDNDKFVSDETWLLACGNTSSYGGGLVICPYAHPIDGVLDVTMLHTVKRRNILFQLFPALLRGTPVLKQGVTYKKGKVVKIDTDRPISIMVDGEQIGTTPVQVTVHAKALHLILTT